MLLAIILFLIFEKKYQLVITIIIILVIFYFLITLHKEVEPNFTKPFKVIEVREKYALISQGYQKYLIYLGDYKLEVGNNLMIKGNYEKLRLSSIPLVSSFNDYLFNKDVYYLINIYELTNDNYISFSYKLKNYLLDRLPLSHNYLNLMLFNYKSSEVIDFYDELVNINAIQLFVISGFHLNLIKLIFDKLSKLIKIDLNIPSFLMMLFYLYLLDFSLSSLRAFLAILGRYINKKYQLNMLSINIDSLIALLFMIINPKVIFLTSFKLAFLMVFSLDILRNLPSRFKYLKIFLPFFISLPFIINLNSKVGVFNILMNYLLSPLVSIVFVVSLISLLLPFLDKFLFILFIGVEEVIIKISSFNFYLTLRSVSYEYIVIYLVLIYLIILFLYLRKKDLIKYPLILISVLILNYVYIPYDKDYLLFFDVGQGDCALIHVNKKNMLIDTGGSIYKDIAVKVLIPYFVKAGIRKIDVVWISHYDYDHYGALESLKENFKVVKCLDYNENYLDFEGIEIFNLNNYYSFEDEENFKSAVLVFDFLNLKFLFSGDADKKIEANLVRDYDLDVDVLKVGHHGSNTSTSKEFVEKISPKVALISVGKNKYGHPHQEVIDILRENKVVIYRTDLKGCVKFSKNIFGKTIIQCKL